MGRLAGFGYFEVARRLRRLGFEFDRQAKGSHEIWRHTRDGPARSRIASGPR
jgi:predicted RNA binding protein YcfA (HicA-like mRNA interferase family)